MKPAVRIVTLGPSSLRYAGLFALTSFLASSTAPAAQFIDLGNLPMSFTDASDDASVIVGNAFVSGNRAFRWEAEVAVDLGIEDSVSAVSGDGSIAVARDGGVAFKSQEGILTHLDRLPGAADRLHVATAISPDGSIIVGTGDLRMVRWDGTSP